MVLELSRTPEMTPNCFSDMCQFSAWDFTFIRTDSFLRKYDHQQVVTRILRVFKELKLLKIPQVLVKTRALVWALWSDRRTQVHLFHLTQNSVSENQFGIGIQRLDLASELSLNFWHLSQLYQTLLLGLLHILVKLSDFLLGLPDSAQTKLNKTEHQINCEF